MVSNEQERFLRCYGDWMMQQDHDLDELLHAMSQRGGDSDDARLRGLVEKSMQHYDEYSEKRRLLVREDPPSFFCPAWCTSFENSFLWIGGCRPSMSIRLLYALSGSELEAHLDDFLRGVVRSDLVGLSPAQLSLVNELHCRTLREEDKLSARMASLQESVADKPLVPVVKARAARAGSNNGNGNGNGNGEVEEVMERYAGSLASVIEEADKLRVETTREIVLGILNPVQAVELLIGAKQLHVSVHEWGQTRDRRHGRG